MKQHLKMTEVAQYLDVSVTTLWRLRRDDASFPRPMMFGRGEALVGRRPGGLADQEEG